MQTDFTPHPPHDNYTATLKLRGTRDEFRKLSDIISLSELNNAELYPDESRLCKSVIREIDELVNWIDTNEPYGV